ncbi:hypothetical protein [Pelomonas sp. SE-A7]|uniref:hypothetical protein n=1 Tax=Pelomonas sp. SE-A7 TaxID=3054953 RepID=UPI00259D08F1|nr:hypothetical protein [Pelomonas sp. SE-A7]MDM4766590.1 hypothetical protein [Pelomonas sp. SE-A7]
MIRLLVVVGLVWLALMPPLFTDGACTAEYLQAESLVGSSQASLKTPESARDFLAARGLEVRLLTPDDCARAKPRFLSQCGSGSLVYASVPVRNKVCSFYRDDSSRIQLHYDRRNRLLRTVTEMKPHKYLPLPWGGRIDWAR